MFTITPIGSCRIHTPLRMAEQIFGYARNLTGIYGFSHSSAEAVQQVKFLQGDYIPHPSVWPLIAPAQPMDKMINQSHALSDLYIVELSSAKKITIEGECVQLNYLSRHFETFFKDKKRVRALWNIAQDGNQDKIDAFLMNIDAIQSEEQFQVIRKLRYELTPRAELEKDVSFLLGALPEVLFVTHVDAVKPDGNLIESRSNYIEMVESVVKSAGGKLQNPTALMNEFGQEQAIEDHSAGLAHFTEPFSEALFGRWFDEDVYAALEKAAMSDVSDCSGDDLVSGLRGLLRVNPEAKILPRIEAAIRELGPSEEMDNLRSYCLALQGDAIKEIDMLRAGLRAYPDDIALLERFVRLSGLQGYSLEAYGFVQKYLEAGTRLPSPLLLELAAGLEKIGKVSEALELLGKANAFIPENKEIITGLATLGLAAKRDDVINECKILLRAGGVEIDQTLTAKIFLWRTQNDDFATYLKKVGVIPLKEFLLVLNFLDEQGQESQVARAISAYATVNPDILTHVVTRRIFEKLKDNLDSDLSRPKQLAILEQVLRINPDQSKAKAAFVTLRREIQLEVRELIKANDIESIEALKPEVSLLIPPLVEYDLFRARTYFKQGQHQKALDAAQTILVSEPEHSISWLMCMRCAFSLKNYFLVDIAARKFIEFAVEKQHAQLSEAHKRLEQIPKLCLVAAREEADPFRSWALAKICHREVTLQSKANQQFARIEKVLLIRTKDIAEVEPDQFDGYLAKVMQYLPDNEQLMMIAARFYMDQQNFRDALGYWLKLAELKPEDTSIIDEMTRCNLALPVAKAS